jgi:DNA-binding NtrC family response regulator
MQPLKPFGLCLIVDDDQDVLIAARMVVRDLFADVLTTSSPAEAVEAMKVRLPDVVLLDANFARGATDGREGFQWLGRMLDIDPGAAVVLITAHAGVQIAVEAMKRGATDFVSKPWNNERLLTTVRTAAALRASRREQEPERPAATATRATSLLGHSPAMARVASLIEKAGPTDANVLILGENGTGKELVARELHRHSRRARNTMLSVDLGAIAESLFDSELFGHVKGAFTDAQGERIGRLQSANGGTLFLDEVGNLPLHLQPKLLTALEQRCVTMVGATKPVPIDIRVISATNLSTRTLNDPARFRLDLLYRLNTVEIELPPLRDRPEDIPLLLNHYLGVYAKQYGKSAPVVPADVIRTLSSQRWPGNVRELRHSAERAVILSERPELSLTDFPASRDTPQAEHAHGPSRAASEPDAPDLNLDRAERRLIEDALKKNGYNISVAAAELGLTRGSLYRRMEKHGL